MKSSADGSDRAASASLPLGNLEHRVPLGLSSLNVLSGHPLVANTHKHFRLSEADLLGVSGLDSETQHALFPNLPSTAAASNANKWKWSDIGSAPVLHDFVKHAHAKPFAGTTASAQEAEAAAITAAAAAAAAPEHSAAALQHATVTHTGSNSRVQRTGIQTGNCNIRHSQSPDPENYLVALRWGTPASSPLPQQKINGNPSSSRAASPHPLPSCSPHPGRKPLPNPGTAASALDSSSLQLQADGSSSSALKSNFRTVSPSVARACVTLPGFSSPPRAQAPGGRGPHVEQGGTHPEQSQHDSEAQGDKDMLWSQGQPGRGALGPDPDAGPQHEHKGKPGRHALGPDPDPAFQHEHRGRQPAAADLAEQWIGQIALPKALPGSRLDTSLLKEWLMQHLASLHSCQAQVTAAETASRQKRHSAAAAAAVTAAKLEAGEEEEDVEVPAEGASQQLGVALTLPGHDAPASVQLPARVVAAAAAAASAAAMKTAVTAHTADSGAVPNVAGPFQHITNTTLSEHSKIASSSLVASRAAGQLHTHSQTATPLNPGSTKQMGAALHDGRQGGHQSVLGYVGAAGGPMSQQVLQKQLQVMSVCFQGLCYEVTQQCQERGNLMADLWRGLCSLTATSVASCEASQLGLVQGLATAEALQCALPVVREQYNREKKMRAAAEQQLAAASAKATSDGARWREEVDLKQARIDMLVAGDRAKEADFMAQRVRELQEDVRALRGDLAASQREVTAGQQRHAAAREQMQVVQHELEGLRRERPGLTPRPTRDVATLKDLINNEKLMPLLEAALFAKVPTEDLQRLLTGGSHLGPFFKWTGALRAAFAKAESYNEASGRWGAVSRRLMAAYLRNKNVASLKGQIPDFILDMSVGALQHGVSPQSLVGLLNGNVSDSGVDVTSFKDLGGCLSRLGEEERRIGSPLTEAIKIAQHSSVDRFAELQGLNRSLHQEVTQLRQQLTHIAEEKEAAAAAEKRRLTDQVKRRPERNRAFKELLGIEWEKNFVGLGLDEEVPKFLRTNAKIKNRHMSKVDAEMAIQEVWSVKKLCEKEKQASVHLQDFLYTHLVRKYGDPRMVLEVGYNLTYSWHKYSSDADCCLVLKVLMGNVPEETYHAQQKLQVDVLDLFRMVDQAANGALTGALPRREIQVLLRGYLSETAPGQLQQLFDALDQEQTGDVVQYRDLFLEDNELNQGPFMELLRHQHLDKCVVRYQHITDCILEAAHDRGLEGRGIMTADDLQAALSKVVPPMKAKEAAKLMAWGLGPDWQGTNASALISNVVCGIRRGMAVAPTGNQTKLARGLSRLTSTLPRTTSTIIGHIANRTFLPESDIATKVPLPPKPVSANRATVATRAVKPRQPIALGPQGQNQDGSRKLTRSLAAVPRPVQPASPEPAPSLAAVEEVHSVSHAISRGRSGVKDIQGLLGRQPSMHPPMRAPTPTSSLKQDHMDHALVASPFAAAAVRPGSVQSQGSHGLSQETSGTALSSLTAASVHSLSMSTAAQTAQEITGKQHGMHKPKAGQLLGLAEGQLPGTDPARLQREPSRSIGPSPSLQLDLSQAVSNTQAVQRVPSQAGTALNADALPFVSTAVAKSDIPAVVPTAEAPRQTTALPAVTKQSLSDGFDTGKVVQAVQQGMQYRQSRSSSSASTTRSVTFEAAEAAAMQGAGSGQALQRHDDALQASRAQRQMFHPLRAHIGANGVPKTGTQSEAGPEGHQKLARLASSLTAAVSETMQDRTVAGGMMHNHADRCAWPRSILKHTGAEQLPSLTPSHMSRTSSIINSGKKEDLEVKQDVESRRNMPVQLARHHSSLNQVSRRPDFAAAMSAVRASWREEEMDRSTVACVRAAEVLQDDMHEQSSLDAIWASISHID